MPKTLIAGEEEQLVLDDGSSHVAAKLVLGKRRTGIAARIGKEIVRIQHFVAQKLVGGAVESVSARLCLQVDHSAGKSPVLRAQVVRLDFEFLNGILRGYHGHDVQVRAVGRHAVYQDLALPCLAAADLEISRSEGIGADRIAGGGIAMPTVSPVAPRPPLEPPAPADYGRSAAVQ